MRECCEKWKSDKGVTRVYCDSRATHYWCNYCPTCGERLEEVKSAWQKWIDATPDNVLTIEEVRQITKKIPYSMAKDSMGEYNKPKTEWCEANGQHNGMDGYQCYNTSSMGNTFNCGVCNKPIKPKKIKLLNSMLLGNVAMNDKINEIIDHINKEDL